MGPDYPQEATHLWTVGDRVVTPSGVGHIERMDDDTADVRMLTPNNVPSVMLSVCWLRDLMDGTNVFPQRRSTTWWRKANAFIGQLSAAATDLQNSTEGGQTDGSQ